jgi:uncharacterized membrane protein HdeD (DUF308 family)
MEPNPTPPNKPDGTRAITWPLIINLGILVLVAAFSGADMDILSGAIGLLVLINGVAGIILIISKHRMHYALAFFLSALLLLLIGAGVCGLMLSNIKGGH